MASCSRKGDASLQLHRRNDALSGRVFTALFLLTRRLYCIVLYVLLGDARCPLVDIWRVSLFLQKTLVSLVFLLGDSDTRVELRSRYSYGRTVFRGGNGVRYFYMCPLYRQLRRTRTGLHTTLSHFRCICAISWIRRPET